MLPVEPVAPVEPLKPTGPNGPVKITFVLVDQETVATLFEATHDIRNPVTSILTTLT